MPVISAPEEYTERDLFVDLDAVLGRPLLLKCEGFNVVGSADLEAAAVMVDAAVRDGSVRAWSTLVAASSNDLGVALAAVAASRGHGFVWVVDPWCDATTRRLVEALGGRVHTVTAVDPERGSLGARLDHVARLCAERDDHVRLDRFAHASTAQSHYRTTGPAIVGAVPDLDVLVVSASTPGVVAGCARYLREHRPGVRLVAVDGTGPGAASPPVDASVVDDVVPVAPSDAVLMCRRLAAHGYLFGGATGAVVSGALAWSDARGDGPHTVVAVAPDLGARCLDTVFDRAWVAAHCGEGLADLADAVARDSALAGTTR